MIEYREDYFKIVFVHIFAAYVEVCQYAVDIFYKLFSVERYRRGIVRGAEVESVDLYLSGHRCAAIGHGHGLFARGRGVEPRKHIFGYRYHAAVVDEVCAVEIRLVAYKVYALPVADLKFVGRLDRRRRHVYRHLYGLAAVCDGHRLFAFRGSVESGKHIRGHCHRTGSAVAHRCGHIAGDERFVEQVLGFPRLGGDGQRNDRDFRSRTRYRELIYRIQFGRSVIPPLEPEDVVAFGKRKCLSFRFRGEFGVGVDLVHYRRAFGKSDRRQRESVDRVLHSERDRSRFVVDHGVADSVDALDRQSKSARVVARRKADQQRRGHYDQNECGQKFFVHIASPLNCNIFIEYGIRRNTIY